MAGARRFQFSDPDDEYWNSKSSGDRVISFEDFPAEKTSVKNIGENNTSHSSQFYWNELDDEAENGSRSKTSEVETIEWSGELVSGAAGGMGSSRNKSGSFQNDIGLNKTLSPNALLLTASRLPETSGSKTPEFQSASLSPEMGRKVRGQSATSLVSEGSQGSSGANTAHIDYSRLKSEHKKLQLRYEQVRQERYRAPEIEETIRRLLRGETAILELYKSKTEKFDLLDAALAVCDGNVILAVVLFLRRSLSNSLFYDMLLRKETAADHFVAHLRQHSNQQELTNALFSLGRNEDAAMVEFWSACKKQTGSAQVSGLKRALQSGFSDPNLGQEAQLITEYVALLERQLPIDASDDTAMRQGREQKFKAFPKTASLVNQPVLTTLYYCSLYHYDLPQNSYASPLALREQHRLTEKQYCWVGVKALSRLKRWADIERLLTTKKLLGGAKLSPPLPWSHLLAILSRYGASHDTLTKYVRHVPELDDRLKLAKEYECNQVIVDCLVGQKDRQQLIEFVSTLTQHTNDYYYGQGALNNASSLLAFWRTRST